MLFKNKSMLITPVNTKQALPINSEEPTVELKARNNYINDLGALIHFNVEKVVKAVIVYKAATTILRAAEHVVVTKVK